MTTDTSQSPPDGYTLHARRSPLTEPWFPLYSRVSESQVQMGTYLRQAHCNRRGLVHGGFIAAIADNSMGLSLGRVLQQRGTPPSSVVTLNLSTDYLGMAKVGAWFETDARVLKAGRATGFVETHIMADGTLIARANATFSFR